MRRGYFRFRAPGALVAIILGLIGAAAAAVGEGVPQDFVIGESLATEAFVQPREAASPCPADGSLRLAASPR